MNVNESEDFIFDGVIRYRRGGKVCFWIDQFFGKNGRRRRKFFGVLIFKNLTVFGEIFEKLTVFNLDFAENVSRLEGRLGYASRVDSTRLKNGDLTRLSRLDSQH